MKTIAITRPVDHLGRVVIPMEIRKRFELKNDSLLEIFVEDDMLILKKFNSKCAFCESEDELHEYNDKFICDKCLKEIENLKSNKFKD